MKIKARDTTEAGQEMTHYRNERKICMGANQQGSPRKNGAQTLEEWALMARSACAAGEKSPRRQWATRESGVVGGAQSSCKLRSLRKAASAGHAKDM